MLLKGTAFGSLMTWVDWIYGWGFLKNLEISIMASMARFIFGIDTYL